ncbi:MAG: EI24 domain-containing protein [Rhodobacter sp.]|nr:EI24 domain-containing protein [Rhodobacter sp.]
MIIGDFLKAIGQIGDPRFRRVLFLGLGLTIALLFAVYALFLGLVNWLAPDTVTLPILGEVTWVDDLLSGASILLMLILSVFLMVPVASAFTGIFLEDVAAAVEDRHYPHLPDVPRLPFTEALTDSLNFLAIIIAANLLALVLYVFFVPAAPFIFWGLNGYLLGREYFQLVAMRRIGRKAAKAAYRRNVAAVWLAGLFMAIPLTVPLLNLVIPILGVATFTHLFQRLEPSG